MFQIFEALIFKGQKKKNKTMNKPVNFELAKLLKEKGFKNLCLQYYNKNGLHSSSSENGSNTDTDFSVDLEDLLENWNEKNLTVDGLKVYSAPTISEVVMWLYEKHEIWIVVMPKRKDKVLFWGGHIDTGKDEFMKSYGSNFNSPAEAYEAAIEYALKTLIKIK